MGDIVALECGQLRISCLLLLPNKNQKGEHRRLKNYDSCYQIGPVSAKTQEDTLELKGEWNLETYAITL